MANPLKFKPPAVDPRKELNRRVAVAPEEHAEALLVAWDVLEAAHEQGFLDAVHGLMVAKDTIFGELAAYANLPEGVAGIRNLIALAKIFAAIDPETLEKVADSFKAANQEYQREKTSPSLWQIARRVNNDDSRRGLSFMTLLLSSVGRSLK